MSQQMTVVDNEDSPQFEAPARSTFVESQARGEVDIQISTARRFPRSIKRFQQDAMSLATLDEDTAASCFYSLPRDGKVIEGPSARLAEIAISTWGNLRAQANVVDIDEKFVTTRGVCWDLEKNSAVSTEVRRRITGKNNKRFSDDMIVTTANAACSIALRNAVFKVIPLALVRPVYDAARKVAIGDAQTLNARRQKMVEHFGKMGVRPEQIAARVGKPSIEDITLDDLPVLIGLATAIKEGDTTVDEAFPTATATEQAIAANASKSEKLAAQVKGNKKADKPAPVTFDDLFKQVQEATEPKQLEDLVALVATSDITPEDRETLEGAIKHQEQFVGK